MTRKQPVAARLADQRQGPQAVPAKANAPKRTRITPQIAALILSEIDGGRSIEQTAKEYGVRQIECLEIAMRATRREMRRAA